MHSIDCFFSVTEFESVTHDTISIFFVVQHLNLPCFGLFTVKFTQFDKSFDLDVASVYCPNDFFYCVFVFVLPVFRFAAFHFIILVHLFLLFRALLFLFLSLGDDTIFHGASGASLLFFLPVTVSIIVIGVPCKSLFERFSYLFFT